YHKPAFLLTEADDGILRGSARSIEGLHITEAIAANKDLLLNFGGHPMAAGVSLEKENLSSFRRGLGQAIERQLGETAREEPTMQIDAWLDLSEIDLALAEKIEMLAPFGAGNPRLMLATRNVSMKSASEIGKTKEHLRLTVEDESGNTQNILWWGGAGEELPESKSKFDIAYSLRASTFRGQKQVTLQFEEFRATNEKPIEVQEQKLDIEDWRANLERLELLSPQTLIWAEGADREKGRSRFDLHPADEFAIYTVPPSHSDLRVALQVVKPKKVYVLGIAPEPEKVDNFLARLAGMAKYVINNKGGRASVQEFASATAQRESAVRIGLEWLAAAGHVSIASDEEALIVSKESNEANQYLQKELFGAVKGILDETAAYRAHFSKADVNSLMELR
ncbi:MAG: DHHA1 domain-containing protein, partial [Anaerolineales bacterium]|nr:DHHA1 domain-containing protein [Anaerolineales bacterium]